MSKEIPNVYKKGKEGIYTRITKKARTCDDPKDAYSSLVSDILRRIKRRTFKDSETLCGRRKVGQHSFGWRIDDREISSVIDHKNSLIRVIRIPKKDGSYRIIHEPLGPYKNVLRSLVNKVLLWRGMVSLSNGCINITPSRRYFFIGSLAAGIVNNISDIFSCVRPLTNGSAYAIHTRGSKLSKYRHIAPFGFLLQEEYISSEETRYLLTYGTENWTEVNPTDRKIESPYCIFDPSTREGVKKLYLAVGWSGGIGRPPYVPKSRFRFTELGVFYTVHKKDGNLTGFSIPLSGGCTVGKRCIKVEPYPNTSNEGASYYKLSGDLLYLLTLGTRDKAFKMDSLASPIREDRIEGSSGNAYYLDEYPVSSVTPLPDNTFREFVGSCIVPPRDLILNMLQLINFYRKKYIGGKYIIDGINNLRMVRVDIKDAFESIKTDAIESVIPANDLFTGALSRFVDLVSVDGHLPIGFPTSPDIFDAVLAKCDKYVSVGVFRENVRSSSLRCVGIRYFDDYVFILDRDLVGWCISLVSKALSIRGLKINEKKIKVSKFSAGWKALGCSIVESNIGFLEPRISKKDRENIGFIHRHGTPQQYLGSLGGKNSSIIESIIGI